MPPDFFVNLRSLVTYIILTDTASRPQFIDLLLGKNVKDLKKNDMHEGKRIKSRIVWMHTEESKNRQPEDKYLPCCCPERFENYHDEDGEPGSPCSQFSCGYNIIKVYSSVLPPNSEEFKFMRNYARKKKEICGFLRGKGGNMGYKQVQLVYKYVGEKVLSVPVLGLTPGSGRSTGITLMARQGLSDEAICNVSGHMTKETMRGHYLQAGPEEISQGSLEISKSRLQNKHVLDLTLEDVEEEELLALPPPVALPVAVAAEPSGSLQMLLSAVDEQERQRTPPLSSPSPRRGRPQFSLNRGKKRKTPSPQAKENSPLGSVEDFPLSQPLPVAHQKFGGVLQGSRTFGTNMALFNSLQPNYFGHHNMALMAQPAPKKAPPVFNNCTFNGAMNFN